MIGYKSKEASPLSKKVEAFALNLLHLIRGARVYPPKHPTLVGIVKNVLDSAPLDSAGLLTIGVTPKELVVSGEFIAGKATNLASILHARKVLQIFWTKDVTLDQVWAFAQVLSTPKAEGVELRRRLHGEGVFTIDIEPLRLDQIHSEITDAAKESEDPEKRRRRAWLALMTREAPAEQLAAALASEEFWDTAKAEWMESGLGDSEGFTKFLLALGDRLEEALALLPDGQREDILDYLSQMGKCLSVKDLVRIVGREGQESKRLGLGTASLLKGIDAERFIDLLAGIAAMGDHGTHRFAEVYRRFAPTSKTEEILSLVRSRLSPGKDNGFTMEVWKTVEDLILNLTENPFMDQEYSGSFELLANSSRSEGSEEKTAVLLENPDEFMDQLILALASEEEEGSRKKVLDRIRKRSEQLGPLRVLGFVRVVDRTFPGLLDATPSLVKDLFQNGLSAISKASIMERQALINFAVAHEKRLLDAALKALAEENRISTRHFLVGLLSCFSSGATPAFVLKSRTSPWFVARNLAIVLGQQGTPQVLAPLRALSRHTHPKVRREALRAEKKIQTGIAGREGDQGGKAFTALILQDTREMEQSNAT